MNNEARDFLEHNPVLMLANVGEDGLPKIRPMIVLGIYLNKLWFAVTKDKLVYKELMHDNNVELCAVTLSRWIRITGKAVFETDKELIAHVRENSDIMEKFYKNKSQDDSEVRVFYIDIERGILSDSDRDFDIEVLAKRQLATSLKNYPELTTFDEHFERCYQYMLKRVNTSGKFNIWTNNPIIIEQRNKFETDYLNKEFAKSVYKKEWDRIKNDGTMNKIINYYEDY